MVLCLLAAALFFGDALFSTTTLIPTGFLYGHLPWSTETMRSLDPSQQYDLVYQFFPWADFLRQTVRSGQFPLWNPYTYLGTPFFANPQTAVLFPPTWLHLLFDLRYSFTLLFLVKLAGTLTGMFCWLRSRRLDWTPSLLGAAIYGFSMHTVVSLPFPYSNVTLMLPWLLWAVTALARRPSRASAAAAAAAACLVVFAGQPQSALPAFLAAALYGALEIRRSAGAGREQLSRLALLTGAGLAGGLLSAVQWLPSLDYVSESMISAGPRIIKSGYPYPPGSFLSFLTPDFFGSHLRGDFWGFPGYHDSAFYSGALTLILAGFAFLLPGSEGRPSRPWPAALTALAALSILLGLPFAESLLDLPGFDLIRRNKFVFLLIFALAESAAWGLQKLLHMSTAGRRRLTAALIGLAGAHLLLIGWGLFWFADFLSRLDPSGAVRTGAERTLLLVAVGLSLILLRLPVKAKAAALTAVVCLDLVLVSWPLNPRGDSRFLYREPALNQRLTGPLPRIYSTRNAYNPNSAMPFALQDIRGYDVMTPRRLFRYMQRLDPNLGNAYRWLMSFPADSIHRNTRMRRIIGAALAEYGDTLKDYLQTDSYWSVTAERLLDPRLFQNLHLEYVVGPWAEPLDTYHPVAGTDPTPLFRNPAAHEAALFSQWVEAEPDAALDRLQAVDPTRIAVVEASLPPPAAKAPDLAGVVTESARGVNCVTFEVDLATPAVLVHYERYSAGWMAAIDDGAPQAMFQAQGLFRGLWVPAGQHRVSLSYSPQGFQIGGRLSLGTLAALALVGLLWRPRPDPSGAPPYRPSAGTWPQAETEISDGPSRRGPMTRASQPHPAYRESES